MCDVSGVLGLKLWIGTSVSRFVAFEGIKADAKQSCF